jgi:hypothetical protein
MNRASEPEVRRAEALGHRSPPPVDKIARSLGKRRRSPVVEDARVDPIAELRRLVGIHKNLATEIQRYESGIKDRRFVGDDGSEVLVKCTKSAAAIADIQRACATLKADQAALVSKMTAELRKVPIYKVFLRHVYGVGSILAAYLVAMVRIDRCPNFSHLNRYCGNAPDYKSGWRENRNGSPKYDPSGKITGGTGTFNDALRRNNYLILTTMRKCAAKKTADAPHGMTTKYLDRWLEASHAERTMPVEPRMGYGGKLRRPIPDAKGRMKATDLFLWDLYLVWRSLEGLDVRHDKESVRRGQTHDGRPVALDERFHLTVEQALEWIGDVGARPATQPMQWKAKIEDDQSDLGPAKARSRDSERARHSEAIRCHRAKVGQ